MIRTLLSALFSPLVATLRADRDLLRLECASLRAELAEKGWQLAELTRRAESDESQLAELRGRLEPMAMVYPWLNEERKVTA